MHMIDEKQTPLPEEEKTSGQALDEAIELQRASEAARRNMLDDQPLELDELPAEPSSDFEDGSYEIESSYAAPEDRALAERRQKRRRSLTAVAAGAALVTAGFAAHAAGSDPNFSDETHEFTFESGDGLETAANTIIGKDSIDIRDAEHHIKSDPANIDVFKDNRIDPGETVVVPDSVE